MATKPARVSMGMPVHNGEKYLRAALDSLLAQTFTGFELIISDNASTDGTESICRDYAARDPRIRYSRNHENIGAAPNMTRVFDLAVGEYFKWAAHDDLHAPTFLERCVEILDHDPSVVLSFSKIQHIDSNGANISLEDHTGGDILDSQGRALYLDPLNPPQKLDSPHAYQRFSDTLEDPYVGLYVFGLMRSDVLRSTAGQEAYVGSDRVVNAEMALRGRIHTIPEHLFFWRNHHDQSSLLVGSSRQRWHCGPNQKKVRRFQYLPNYFRAMWRARLPLNERTLCHFVLFNHYTRMVLKRWRSAGRLRTARRAQRVLVR